MSRVHFKLSVLFSLLMALFPFSISLAKVKPSGFVSFTANGEKDYKDSIRSIEEQIDERLSKGMKKEALQAALEFLQAFNHAKDSSLYPAIPLMDEKKNFTGIYKTMGDLLREKILGMDQKTREEYASMPVSEFKGRLGRLLDADDAEALRRWAEEYFYCQDAILAWDLAADMYLLRGDAESSLACHRRILFCLGNRTGDAKALEEFIPRIAKTATAASALGRSSVIFDLMDALRNISGGNDLMLKLSDGSQMTITEHLEKCLTRISETRPDFSNWNHWSGIRHGASDKNLSAAPADFGKCLWREKIRHSSLSPKLQIQDAFNQIAINLPRPEKQESLAHPAFTDRHVVYMSRDYLVVLDAETGKSAMDPLPLDFFEGGGKSWGYCALDEDGRAYVSNSFLCFIPGSGECFGNRYCGFNIDQIDMNEWGGKFPRRFIEFGNTTSKFPAVDQPKNPPTASIRAEFGMADTVLDPHPCFHDGILYLTGLKCMSDNGRLEYHPSVFALDPERRSLLWKTELGQSGESGFYNLEGQYSCLDAGNRRFDGCLTDGNNIYAYFSSGVLACLEASSGRTLWMSRIPSNREQSPAANGRNLFLADGRVIARQGGSAGLNCWDSLTGELLWCASLPGLNHALGIIDNCFVCTTDKTIQGLDLETGLPLWSWTSPDVIRHMGAISGHEVCVPTSSGVYRIGIETGLVYKNDKGLPEIKAGKREIKFAKLPDVREFSGSFRSWHEMKGAGLKDADCADMEGDLYLLGERLYSVNEKYIHAFSNAETEKALADHLELGNTPGAFHFLRGRLRSSRGQFMEAAEDYRNSLAVLSADSEPRRDVGKEIRFHLSRAYGKMVETEKDVLVREKALRRALETADGEDMICELHRISADHHEAGRNWQDAFQSLLSIIRQSPNAMLSLDDSLVRKMANKRSLALRPDIQISGAEYAMLRIQVLLEDSQSRSRIEDALAELDKSISEDMRGALEIKDGKKLLALARFKALLRPGGNPFESLALFEKSQKPSGGVKVFRVLLEAAIREKNPEAFQKICDELVKLCEASDLAGLRPELHSLMLERQRGKDGEALQTFVLAGKSFSRDECIALAKPDLSGLRGKAVFDEKGIGLLPKTASEKVRLVENQCADPKFKNHFFVISNSELQSWVFVRDEPKLLWTLGRPMDFAGISVEENTGREGELRLTGLSPKSPFYQAGLREGDVLVSLESESIMGLGHLKAKYSGLGKLIRIETKSGKICHVEVKAYQESEVVIPQHMTQGEIPVFYNGSLMMLHADRCEGQNPSVLWSIKIPETLGKCRLLQKSGMVLLAGRDALRRNRSHVFAFDAVDGTLLWRKTLAGSLQLADLRAESNYLALPYQSAGSQLLLLDLFSGQSIFNKNRLGTGATNSKNPGYFLSGNTIVFEEADYLSAYDPDGLLEKYRITMGKQVEQERFHAVKGGDEGWRLLTIKAFGGLSAMDMESGKNLWAIKAGDLSWKPANRNWKPSGEPTLHCDGSRLYCLYNVEENYDNGEEGGAGTDYFARAFCVSLGDGNLFWKQVPICDKPASGFLVNTAGGHYLGIQISMEDSATSRLSTRLSLISGSLKIKNPIESGLMTQVFEDLITDRDDSLRFEALEEISFEYPSFLFQSGRLIYASQLGVKTLKQVE